MCRRKTKVRCWKESLVPEDARCKSSKENYESWYHSKENYESWYENCEKTSELRNKRMIYWISALYASTRFRNALSLRFIKRISLSIACHSASVFILVKKFFLQFSKWFGCGSFGGSLLLLFLLALVLVWLDLLDVIMRRLNLFNKVLLIWLVDLIFRCRFAFFLLLIFSPYGFVW